MGEKHTGDSINVGDLMGNTGVAIGRKAQAHVNIGAQQAPATPEAFASLIQELSALLATVPLPDDEQRIVQQDLQMVEAQLAQPTPKLSMIVRGLVGVKSLLETTAAAGTIAVTAAPALQMVQQALGWAQQLFK